MNLALRAGLVTAAIAATLTMACTLPGLSEPEPARTPTYTPYPTFTPATAVPTQTSLYATTAPAVPTQIPLYSTMAPTVDPNLFQEIGSEELFFGSAWTESENGITLMNNGDYQGAIAAFSRAQVHHGEPSVTLENRIGIAFQGLNDHTQAIGHLTVAIAIEDSATDRINRATSYLETERCDLAINDANQALAMTPEYTEGLHTDAEAHTVLGTCHIINNDTGSGAFHLRKALEIATEHGYQGLGLALLYRLNANFLGPTQAIELYTKAIALNDTADVRVDRATAFMQIDDCLTAKADSFHALTMPPAVWSQYHSGAEANHLLASCYSITGDFERALEYAYKAKRIMRENGYPPDHINELEILENAIMSAMNP